MIDTMLATWGLSLILQQAYRSVFGAREVGVELPEWMMGSVSATDAIQIPINGMFVMALTVLITIAVAYILFFSRWGKQVRAVVQNRVMAGAVGINTEKVDRYTFGLGCGIAGRERLHHRLDRPTAGQLYIVDTFMVVVWARKPARHHRPPSPSPDAVDLNSSWIDGQGDYAARDRRHPDDAAKSAARSRCAVKTKARS
jgi:branched-subunit amino acid ABC-type transport system permease component